MILDDCSIIVSTSPVTTYLSYPQLHQATDPVAGLPEDAGDEPLKLDNAG